MVYEMRNPYFPQNIFVFQKIERPVSPVFDKTVFLEMNSYNRIEVIGIDIEERMSMPLDKIIERSNPASESRKDIFRRLFREDFND